MQHAVRVARGLERRWHHIWLRSLEWQCLLEQWIHNPLKDHNPEDSVFDTDDEPLSKVPRMASDLASCTASPASTLLRRKRRKRWPGTPREEEDQMSRTVISISPHHHEPQEEPSKMLTSESEPSSALSTARSASSDSNLGLPGVLGEVDEEQEQRHMASPLTPLSVMDVLEDNIDVDDNSHIGFWDTSDEDALLENTNQLMQKVRKVTVVQAKQFVGLQGVVEVEPVTEDCRRKVSEELYSQDSLEGRRGEGRRRGWLEEGSSLEEVSSIELSSSTEDFEVNFKVSILRFLKGWWHYLRKSLYI